MNAAWDARAGRRVAAAAVAAALQGVFWLILHQTLEPTPAPKSAPLAVTLFAAASRPRPAPPPRKSRHSRLKPGPPSARALSPVAAPIEQPVTVPRLATPAPRASIDWQRAIRGEVRAEELRSRPGKLDFGFPRRRAVAPSAPEFGWDYARTHRVESLRDGGVLINLNDNCVIVIYVVVPLVGCKIGRLPANGHLFDHMRDPGNDRIHRLP